MENVTSHGEIVIRKGPFLNLDLNVNHLTGAEVRDKAAQDVLGYWRPVAAKSRSRRLG